MFDILRKSFKAGIVTTDYPEAPSEHALTVRGRPEIDFAKWKDARASASVCPTGAISCVDDATQRTATLDLSRCTFCGLCADNEPAIRMTTACELATRDKNALRTTVHYRLNPDGTQRSLLAGTAAEKFAKSGKPPLEDVQKQLKEKIARRFGRSLHIREVDAGSCNGCEIEIVGLNSPIYDLERLGIHFVASPRHADMLLVTGPVTRNMELALKKTYEATPPPRLVVAVGACGCSGGIFGQNYASLGGVDSTVPVDVYIPGCPPNPYGLLQGILLAVGREESPRS